MATDSKAELPAARATKASAAEKGDATTRAAREIIERERAARDANTARLKALRLARDNETTVDVPAKSPLKGRKQNSVQKEK